MAEGQVGTLRAYLQRRGMEQTERFLARRIDNGWALDEIEDIVGVNGPPPGRAPYLHVAFRQALRQWWKWIPIIILRAICVVAIATLGAGLLIEGQW